MSRITKGRSDDALARSYLASLAAAGARVMPPSARPSRAARRPVRPELAAVAVMMARAVSRVPGLDVKLRVGNPIVTVATHDAAIVQWFGSVMRICCVPERTVSENGFPEYARRSVLLLMRDGTEPPRSKDAANRDVADALHASAAVIGIAPDPGQHLPSYLVRAADFSLVLDPLDAAGIALVIEAVTGKAPRAGLDDGLARALDLAGLTLSVRPGWTANKCVERIRHLIVSDRSGRPTAPSLEKLVGYGAAREWGLNFVADVNQWRAGLIDWDFQTSLLLVGPPGVGKTRFADSLASSSNLPLIYTSVAAWNSIPYLHGTLAEMRSVFAKAKQMAPAIVFCDELDGIGDRASVPTEWGLYYLQIQNLALELFSEASQSKIALICASNFPDRIDAALRRAGRLDRTIEIGLPDKESLAGIFRQYLGDQLRGADLSEVAVQAVGRTGADVQAWVRNAKARVRREGRPLRVVDLLAEVGEGKLPVPAWLRHSAAVHEAGHLVGGLAVEIFEPHELFLNDNGGLARMNHHYANLQTQEGVEGYITTALSGRAAEEVLLGTASLTIGSGAGEGNDLSLATSAAIDLELKYGMGGMGVAQFSEGTNTLLHHDPAVRTQVKRRLDRCLERARLIAAANRETIEKIAAALERSGHLDRPSILKLLTSHPIRIPEADQGEVAK